MNNFFKYDHALLISMRTRRSADDSEARIARPTAVLMRMTPRGGERVERTLQVRNTIGIAELIHESLVQKAALHRRCDCPELTGHDRAGRPLDRGHRHAHILPVDLDRDGSLDHVLIWVPMGIGPRCANAIDQLDALVTPGGRSVIGMLRLNQDDYPALSRFPHVMIGRKLAGPPDHAVMLANALCDIDEHNQVPRSVKPSRESPAVRPPESGDRDLYMAGPGAASDSIRSANTPTHPGGRCNPAWADQGPHHVDLQRNDVWQSGGSISSDNSRRNRPTLGPTFPRKTRHRAKIIEAARNWVSLTPFVPARFVKPRGKNSLENQIQRELESRGLPPAREVKTIEALAGTMQGFHLARRHGKPQPPRRIAFAVQICFAEPVLGPIALGYASHFGLGVFHVSPHN